MSKFLYLLGWLCIIGDIVGVILIVALGVVNKTPVLSILLQMVWVPFALFWGVKQIREHKPVSPRNDAHL